MIQRIQTVWLFLVALCAALTFKFPFYSGNMIGKDNVQRYEKLDRLIELSSFTIYYSIDRRNDRHNFFI